MLPVLGIHAFEQPQAKTADGEITLLTCHGKGVEAKGMETSQGFVVKVGSQAVHDTAPGMKQHLHGMYELRRDLISSGVLVEDGDYYRFSQDYVFNSPSAAAVVVLGHSVNGRTKWKDSMGRTLKSLQETEAQQTP